MDFFQGGDNPSRDTAIKAFRECLNKYKHQFNEVTIKDLNKQDTAVSEKVILLIDNLRLRILPILSQFEQGHEPKRPTQDTPLEYDLFTSGQLEYLYKDRDAVGEFKRHLDTDLRLFPFTYNTGVIDSYKGTITKPPVVVANEE
jgi:hypothetical protein